MSGRREPLPRVIQQEVKNETTDHGYYATGYPPEAAEAASGPPQPLRPTSAEPGRPEHEEAARSVTQVDPHPATEARRFSAPHVEWDATR